MPHIFNRLFTRSDRNMSDYISTFRLEHEWRSFFTDGTTIDLYGNLEKMAKENMNLSAKDIREYEEFLLYAKRIYEVTEEGYLGKGLDNTMDVFKQHGFIESLKGFDYFSTMYDGIKRE